MFIRAKMNFILKCSSISRPLIRLGSGNLLKPLSELLRSTRNLSINCSTFISSSSSPTFHPNGLRSILFLTTNQLNNSFSSRFFSQQISSFDPTIKGNPIFNLDDDEKAREEEREKTRKRQIKFTRYFFYVICAMFTGSLGWAFVEFGVPQRDEEGNEIIDRFSEYSQPKQIILRTWSALMNIQEDFTGPSRELLLPPPLPYPMVQPPYTLVLELKDILVFFDWNYQSGWGVKTRPNLKKFLELVGYPLFEIVIFTEVSPFTALGILDAIDKDGLIMHRLFRDSTRFIKGKHVKDLNVLNRDLSKTIQIEVDREACSLNSRNCLVLERWKGDTTDQTLLDLSIFLRTIATQKVDDVRDVISHYSQFDNPLEVFKENQIKMMEEGERRKKSQSLTSLVKKKI